MDSFLQRTGDLEDSVATLARQTFEEIWLTPFHGLIDSAQDGPKLKVGLDERVTLIVSLGRDHCFAYFEVQRSGLGGVG
jgi:cohesin loading factor subunit SCC2